MNDLEEHQPTTANGRRNSNGKRFVRRARRWAELQQKRQGRRVFEDGGGQQQQQQIQQLDLEHRRGVPEPPNVYDFVDHSFSMGEEGRGKQCLGPRRSFPCTVLQTRRVSNHYIPNFMLQQNSGLYHHNQICHRTSLDIPIQRYHPPSTGSSQTSLMSSPESILSNDALSLITHDLSTTTISDSSSSPNSSEEEIYSSSTPSKMVGKLFISKPLNDFIVNTVPPPERSWVMIRHADPERPIATFTALCYNVLCDKYATVNQYSYCPSWALNWEYRKTLILKEIRTYEADIVTLQEVETEQFHTLFKTELKPLGYVGIFTPKSRAKTMSEEERKYVDGCAIFWKTDKFELERQHAIEFTALAMKKASTSENMLNRVMPRDNVALCAVLKIKESVYANRRMSIPLNDNVVGNPLVVCTAHIHWDPEFCDVKLVQTMMLAHEVTKLLEEVSKKFNIQTQQCPVLICGDLNSLPDSGVFEYLSRGQISRRHMDLKQFRDDACLEKFTTTQDKNLYAHALRLDSAIDSSNIPFTNYTLDFKGMIDYIFSTPQSLARLGVLGPFDSNWVNSNKILGFPHPHVPSDHIPIMAQYAIIPTTHQRQPPPPQQPSLYPVGVIGSGLQQTHHSFLR